MFKIKAYVVVTGSERLFGPFDTADLAASFLENNYHNFIGNSRIESVWDVAPYVVAPEAA